MPCCAACGHDNGGHDNGGHDNGGHDNGGHDICGDDMSGHDRQRRPRDQVPDQGSVLWNAVPWWHLLGTALVSGLIAGGGFWWSGVDHSAKGPVFLMAIAAIFACIAIGCLVLLVWHGVLRWRRPAHCPS
ncbi:MAG: hypothetical protein H0W78_06135 [Planctomycetes bacterium]|nr:hypothetical protein [Planctomycetota bacterium]